MELAETQPHARRLEPAPPSGVRRPPRPHGPLPRPAPGEERPDRTPTEREAEIPRTAGADLIQGTGGDRAAELRLESPASAVRPAVEPRERSEVASRVVNVTIALVALVLLSPILLLVALAIRLTSPGPVLYRQQRVGLDRRHGRNAGFDERRRVDYGGRLFTIYKFRSMRVDAEADGTAVWAKRNDDRVTPLGRFLRSSRLDELPQLVNVVRGDMNIVGPRPERPCIFARLRQDISEYPLRQLARPGITGWAQINHTYDTSVEDVRVKVRYDLEYLERQSLWTDVMIMVRTVPVMLFRRSGW